MAGLIKDIFLYSGCTPWNTTCLLTFCKDLIAQEAALFPTRPSSILSALRAETSIVANWPRAADPIDIDTEAAALMGVYGVS